MFKKILCPVDFSEGSRSALRTAAQLAAQHGGELVLVHVWTPPIIAMAGEAPLPGDALQKMYEDAERDLAAAASTAGALGVKTVGTHVLEGAAWPMIVETARNDRAIDLVVMGTHGRTGLSHVLLGSVAEQVVRHARCAVLIVRDDTHA
jgi:nucleotide-binding universal stress UspA family protein